MDAEVAAQTLIAHLFQRSGRGSLSESELANAASLDLDWFPPKKARQVVAGLVRAGWLQRDEDGDLRPVFDVREVRVPLAFRPPELILEGLPPPGATAQRAVGGPGRGSEGPGNRTDARSVEEAKTAPSPDVETEGEEDGEDRSDLGGLLQDLSKRSGEEVAVWVERMERVVQRSGDLLKPEVALMLAAAQEGHDVGAAAGRLRKGLEEDRESWTAG